MPSNVFQKVDRRYFAMVISQFLSHGGMDLYETGLGFNSRANGASNKDQRAAATVSHIFEQPNTDELVLDLLDHLFVEPAWSPQLLESSEYKALDDKVLSPRGVAITNDGYKITNGRSNAIPVQQEAAKFTVQETSMGGPAPKAQPEPEDVALPSNAKSVFVVHGRDPRPVSVVDTFLTFCGLQMMAWSDAVRLTGKPQPTTYEIVRSGISAAGSVIVIFSPDDLGRVTDRWATSPDDRDLVPSGQARQNVILEAGMAFALAPSRTIFVQSAPTRALSDIDGFNWVKLNGDWDSRLDLIGRLSQVHGKLTHKANLMDHTAGPFRVVDK